jgi:hypothetical protein
MKRKMKKKVWLSTLNLPAHLPCRQLPTLLEKSVKAFNNIDEQELFTYTSIVSLSGILPNVSGVYAGNIVYPNMFLMVLAPAASGKGIMSHARELLKPVHELYLQESREKLSEYNRIPRKLRGDAPPFKIVFLPANSSSSKMIDHLSTNGTDTPLILFETEMDTLTITNATEFGNYSDILRKVFQNEPVSQSRRMNNEYLEIEKPKLAAVISGTPGQLFKFINNREDGLLSRFLVMNYKNTEGWRNVSPCPTCINLTKHFKNLSKQFLEFYLSISKEEFEVTLTKKQWKRVNSYGEENYNKIVEIYGESATAIIKRHNLILFKICMVLTSLRKYEEKNNACKMVCRDQDFLTALFLVNKSMFAGLNIYEALPREKTPNLNQNKEVLFQSLGDTFLRADALSLAKSLLISERSTDRYLKDFLHRGFLNQLEKGKYEKKKTTPLAVGS